MDLTDFSVWTAWAFELGPYKLTCIVHEDPRDTFLVRVLENGQELERLTVVQQGPADWERVHQVTNAMHVRYQPRFMAHMRTQRP